MSNEITIVVPAYNAERVLPRCLESLLAQTKLPQIIIANDGSVDRTAEIADAAAAQFPAVHVIHMSHGGVNVTRKKAAQAVETPYFAFLDADDRLDSLFVEKMMSAAVGQKADIVYCSYRCLYDGVERHVSYGGMPPTCWSGSTRYRIIPNCSCPFLLSFGARFIEQSFFMPLYNLRPTIVCFLRTFPPLYRC